MINVKEIEKVKMKLDEILSNLNSTQLYSKKHIKKLFEKYAGAVYSTQVIGQWIKTSGIDYEQTDGGKIYLTKSQLEELIEIHFSELASVKVLIEKMKS